MNQQQFRDSLLHDSPPRELSHALSGLWWDAKGDWTKAHESAQQDEAEALGFTLTCTAKKVIP
jgi:hypothetical protein